MKSIKHLYVLLAVVSLGYASTGLGVEDLHITQRNERAKTYDRHENERKKTNEILERLKTHTSLEKTGVSNAYPEGTGKALVYTLHPDDAQALQDIGLSTEGLSGKTFEELKNKVRDALHKKHATELQDMNESQRQQRQNLTKSLEQFDTPVAKTTTDDNDSDHDFDLADDTTPETIQSSTPQEQESIWKKIKRWLHNNTRFKFSDIAQKQNSQFEQNQKKSRNDIAETKREIRQVQQQIEDKQRERNTLTDDVMKKTEIDKTLSTLEDSLSIKKKVLNEIVKDAQSKGYDITPADRDTWFKHESQQIVEDLIDSPDKNLTAQELDNLVRELNSFSFRSKETRISNIMKIINENPTSPHAKAIMDKIKEDLNKDNQGKDEQLIIEQNNKSEYVEFSIDYPELARSFGAQKIGDTTFYKKYGSKGFSINNPKPEAIKTAMVEYITSQDSTATLNSDSSFEAIHSALKTVQKQNPEPATTMLRYFAKI